MGRTQVRLHDIAVGPTKFDLPVHDGAGREVGRIVFTIRMMQKCELAVSVPAATVVMRGGARHTSQASQEAAARGVAFSLTATLTVGEEGESEPIRTDFDQSTLRLLEAFNMELSLPPGGARSAIHVLASATSLETESLHLRVWRGAAGDAAREGGGHKSRLVGEVWLPLTKVYTPGDHAEEVREFSDVLWLHGQRVGRLDGSVRVLNGPRVVQLSGGFFTENGVVPVGPIHQTDRRQLAEGVQRKDSFSAEGQTTTSNGHYNDGTEFVGPLHNGTEFEGPPKGLVLPKEVEALLSLVQTLKKLLLDLQRDTHAPHAPKLNGVGRAGRGEGEAREVPHAATAPELPHVRGG